MRKKLRGGTDEPSVIENLGDLWEAGEKLTAGDDLELTDRATCSTTEKPGRPRNPQKGCRLLDYWRGERWMQRCSRQLI